MGRFCRAAKVQGLACDDHWYKLALQAFGVAPDSHKPAYMLYEWRALFVQLCKAHRDFVDGLWNELAADASQRTLDDALTKILKRWTRARTDAMFGISTDEAKALLKRELDALEAGRRSAPLYATERPANDETAIATLLLIKGAKPWTEEAYRLVDGMIFTAMDRLLRTRGDAIQGYTRSATFDEVKRALDLGANVRRTLNVEGGVWWDTMLPAILSGDGAIINLLLDRGWTIDTDTRIESQWTIMRRSLPRDGAGTACGRRGQPVAA